MLKEKMVLPRPGAAITMDTQRCFLERKTITFYENVWYGVRSGKRVVEILTGG